MKKINIIIFLSIFMTVNAFAQFAPLPKENDKIKLRCQQNYFSGIQNNFSGIKEIC